MKFCDGKVLTLAGLLLIGSNPQSFKPLFSVRCISFVGNELNSGNFKDKVDLLEGNIMALYNNSMDFIIRNLRHIQIGPGFNQLGQLEIPREVLDEILVNSLVHRDYYISSSVQVFIFNNRIEISSPGKLPNTLNENNIQFYTSITRNPIIYSNCAFAGLPFAGIGSGIPRAMSIYPRIQIINDKIGDRFTVIIPRPA